MPISETKPCSRARPHPTVPWLGHSWDSAGIRPSAIAAWWAAWSRSLRSGVGLGEVGERLVGGGVVPEGALRTLEITDLDKPDAQEVRIRLGFDDALWWQGIVFDGQLHQEDGDLEGDGGTFSIQDDLLTMIGAGGTVAVTYQWRLQRDQLTLTVVEECDLRTGTCQQDRSLMDPVMIDVTEHTYTKSGNDPSY